MFIVWGPERTLLYNHAYSAILAGKHPDALGRDFLEVWWEIRADLEPIVEQAYAGRPVHMDDITLLMHRRGYPEETHFAFSYTPVRDEGGRVGGFFCACVETTARVAAERSRADELAARGRLFENAPGFIAVLCGSEHRFELANRAFRRLVGERPCVGRTVREVFPELADQPFFDLLDQVYARGERHAATDARILLAQDGGTEERFLDFVYEPIRDEDGRVTGIFVEGHDVTEAHRGREALREREERLRLVVDGAREYAILTMDPERRITGWSAGAERAFGMTEEEAIGRSADELFTADDVNAGAPQREAETALAAGAAPDQRWHKRADDTLVYINGSVHPLPPDEQGRPRGFLKIGRDETERRKREEELAATRRDLERSEQRFRTALEIETVGAIYFDMDGRIFDANDAFLQMGDYSREELESGALTWRALTPPEFLGVSERAFAELKATGRTTPYEKQYVRRDGSRWWALFAAKLLPDGTGFEFVLDITDRKEAEARSRELNETLERRVIEEVAERGRAEEALRQSQKLEAIGQLTGGVAHDFNNLLTVIRSSADLLRRRELTEERRRRYVDAISDTADRAAKLTGQLLAFARRQALRPEVFDVAARVDGVADMLRTVLGARVELTIEGRCRPCPVEADAAQFETALVNMAVNARDAMDGEGRLTIGIDEAHALPPVRGHSGAEGEFVIVSVADTGAGIPAEVMERIFEPFFTTKEVGRGTGLGLSQVFGFAKQSGGEVAVDSEPGRGTTFRLYLPKIDAAALAEDRRTEGGAPAAGAGRVLVVEDNSAVGEFAAQLLEDLGYETVLAGNAGEALGMLEGAEEPFDLVFSDVVMPGIDGVDFGRRVRERWPGLPVVLTSGYSHVLAQDARHGFPVLHKPYSVEELSRVLREASWGRPRPGSRARGAA
ncbi:hybrid sensor histidine kinase/response regulator [Sphingomonas lenta]|uniref:histidine kinase n=2 Tax=Sphingomonas lenta TaxID=1141887 RepID=A0A2A2SC74_9SPHN|nr:hybrid sensor histidine kinase/response regulator [Sphingomonas lenta]